jgi:dihydrofolate reductase
VFTGLLQASLLALRHEAWGGVLLTQATEKAGGDDVAIGGGADVIRQALAAGRVDELVLSTAPVILGAGKRLFDGFDHDVDLEVVKAVSSPYATHVRYAITK